MRHRKKTIMLSLFSLSCFSAIPVAAQSPGSDTDVQSRLESLEKRMLAVEGGPSPGPVFTAPVLAPAGVLPPALQAPRTAPISLDAPPMACLAQTTEKDGTVVVVVTLCRFQPVFETTLVDGKPSTKVIHTAVSHDVPLRMADRGVRAIGQDGKGIAPKDLVVKLGKKTPVLVLASPSSDMESAVDPVLLKSLREDAVVLIVPRDAPKAEMPIPVSR